MIANRYDLWHRRDVRQVLLTNKQEQDMLIIYALPYHPLRPRSHLTYFGVIPQG